MRICGYHFIINMLKNYLKLKFLDLAPFFTGPDKEEIHNDAPFLKPIIALYHFVFF